MQQLLVVLIHHVGGGQNMGQGKQIHAARHAAGKVDGLGSLLEAEGDIQHLALFFKAPALDTLLPDHVQQVFRGLDHLLIAGPALPGELDGNAQQTLMTIIHEGAGGQPLCQPLPLEPGKQAAFAFMADEIGQIVQGLVAIVGA